MVVVVLAGILVILELFFQDAMAGLHWPHPPVHSVVETLGGAAALAAASILFTDRPEEGYGFFFFAALGLTCMGLLDIFHALCMPGDAFVFLHSAAGLAGSMLFCAVWMPHSAALQFAYTQRWLTWGVVLLTLTVGLRAVFLPADVPNIIRLYDGGFTLAAKIMNTTAGVLFLASAYRFAVLDRRYGNPRFFLLFCVSVLFGLAALTFGYSDIWGGVWWLWHVLRVVAYAVVLLYTLYSFRVLTQALQDCRDQGEAEFHKIKGMKKGTGDGAS